MDRTRLDGSQLFSWLLAGLALVLLWAIVRPFWSALFLAAVLAGVFSGLQARLARQLWGRTGLAAGLLTLLVLLAIVLPFGSIVGLLAKQVIQVINSVRAVIQENGISGLVHRLPGPVQEIAQHAIDAAGGPDWVKMIQSQSGKAAVAASKFLSATSRAVVDAVLMLIAFYFLLVDGRRLVEWLEEVTPLPAERFRTFLVEFRDVSHAVLVSTVGTGAVQSVVALVGYLIAGVPNALLFGLVTFFMSFVPTFGAGSVPVVLSLVLFFQGRTGWGVFLVLWGILAVGLIDNVVKPFFIKGGVEMPGAVIFFALLGGLAAFGPVGLVAGPLVVAFFVAVSRASVAAPREAS